MKIVWIILMIIVVVFGGLFLIGQFQKDGSSKYVDKKISADSLEIKQRIAEINSLLKQKDVLMREKAILAFYKGGGDSLAFFAQKDWLERVRGVDAALIAADSTLQVQREKGLKKIFKTSAKVIVIIAGGIERGARRVKDVARKKS